MRRWLGWLAIGWMAMICVVAVAAYGTAGTTESLAGRTHEIAAELRCPACQGESVADSQTQIARAIRTLIYQQLKRGRSADEIESYLVSRFGDRILMAPPHSGIDWLAWLTPPALVLGGLGLLITLVADWRRGGVRVRNSGADYVERIRAEVASDP